MNMLRLPLILLLLSLSFSLSSPALAALKCEPSSFIKADRKAPRHINKTNNLRRQTGSPLSANGTPIILQGTLLDTRCVPVSDAVVELWQADGEGRFVTEIAPFFKHATKTPFIGSGTTLTNNLGKFTFFTITPGSYDNRSPHVHLRIHHPDFDTFETDIFLDAGAIDADPKLHKTIGNPSALVAKKGTSFSQETYFFDVILRGTGKGYRGF